MPDLHARFRTGDYISVPELWAEIQLRAGAAPTGASVRPRWALVAAIAALVAIGGGAALFSSGILPDPYPSPSLSPAPTPTDSPPASPSPDPTLAPAATGTWTATGEMVHVRSEGFTATLLPDGRVLVAGGAGRASELFDPRTMSWTDGPVMGGDRWGHAAVLALDGTMVLVTGGEAPSGSFGTFNSAEYFDVVTEAWSPHPRMIEARVRHTATELLDGRVLVAGGASDGQLSAELYDPDPTVLQWTLTGDVIAQPDTATLLTDGRVLAVHGSGRPDEPAQLFDPTNATWSATDPTVDVRGGHTATRLMDGRVLVAGGGPCCSWRRTAELFDPRDDTWIETGSMIEARAFFTATLLPDGRVLVTGGGDGGFTGKPTTELYDPRTGSWTAGPDMLSPRGWHAAVALADGRVLVIGGFEGGTPRDLADPGAEVFDPNGG